MSILGIKYGIRVETFMSAGRYQHKVSEFGVKSNRVGEVSSEVVEALKRANEKLYDEMPGGSTGLVAKIEYRAPRK